MRQLEIALVLATGVVFALIPKPPQATAPMAIFIPCCIGFWALFGTWRVRKDASLWQRWGLRPGHELGWLVTRLAPLAALGALGSAGWALAHGRPLWAPYLWLSLLLYPLWGGVQQWLVQCLIIDNTRELTGAPLPVLMVLGAVGFGGIHFQHPLLVVATGLMGMVYVYLFQQRANLWPLAVCHGWLGSLFYPWVLDLNPTAEIVSLVTGS